MNHRKIGAALGILIGLFGLSAMFWGAAHAQNFRSGNSVTVGANEVVDSTMWVAGRSIDLAGEVNGDVFCAGQNVSVTGTIRGDLLCAAQNITISGVITGDVRVAAQSVT